MKSKFSKNPAIAEANLRALRGGMNYGFSTESFTVNYEVAPARLAPEVDDPARGAFLYWMMYTPGAIEPAMMEKFIGFEVNPGSCGWGNYEIVMKTLLDGLADGPWIMGEHFSAADVMLGSSVFFMKQFGLLEEGSALEPYLERCLARPAYQAALERDSELDTA